MHRLRTPRPCPHGHVEAWVEAGSADDSVKARHSPEAEAEVSDTELELAALHAQEHFAHSVLQRAERAESVAAATAMRLEAPLAEAHAQAAMTRRLSRVLLMEAHVAQAALVQAEELEALAESYLDVVTAAAAHDARSDVAVPVSEDLLDL